MNDDFLDPELARAQKREAKTAKARSAQDDAVVQALMSSVGGRAWMRDLLEFCACFVPIASENPYFTYLNEGRRNVGLRLLADVMRACPDAYIQMMKESADGRRSDLDRSDRDADANYDASGRWIGDGEE